VKPDVVMAPTEREVIAVGGETRVRVGYRVCVACSRWIDTDRVEYAPSGRDARRHVERSARRPMSSRRFDSAHLSYGKRDGFLCRGDGWNALMGGGRDHPGIVAGAGTAAYHSFVADGASGWRARLLPPLEHVQADTLRELELRGTIRSNRTIGKTCVESPTRGGRLHRRCRRRSMEAHSIDRPRRHDPSSALAGATTRR